MGKLLFCPVLTYGHFNCCINLGKYLLDKYPGEHEVYFLLNELWRDKLEKWAPEFKTLVFEQPHEILEEICAKIEAEEQSTGSDCVDSAITKNEIKVNGTANVKQNGWDKSNSISKTEQQTAVVETPEVKKEEIDSPSTNQLSKDKTKADPKEDPLNKLIQEFGKTWKLDALGRLSKLKMPFRRLVEGNALIEEQVLKLVHDLKPDLILFDQVCMVPYLLSPYPWGQIMTMNPLFIDHNQLPPSMSGLSTHPTPENQAQWAYYRQEAAKELKFLRERQNQDLRRLNQPELQPGQFIFSSPYINIYIYPREIDYFDGQRISMPGRWIRMDSSFRPENEITQKLNQPKVRIFEQEEERIAVLKERFDFITDEWTSKPGKLVYFSLGSMASAYLELTTRLVKLLGEIPHRFIVSKGPLGDEFELPSNCVGNNFLDQNTVLQCVDMIITHGGNNTLTECFHYGKPQLVLPLFSDQPDNAQRMLETGFGGRLDAFQCTAKDIQDQIDHLTSNKSMIHEMRIMAEKMRKDNGMDAAVDEIATFLNKQKDRQPNAK